MGGGKLSGPAFHSILLAPKLPCNHHLHRSMTRSTNDQAATNQPSSPYGLLSCPWVAKLWQTLTPEVRQTTEKGFPTQQCQYSQPFIIIGARRIFAKNEEFSNECLILSELVEEEAEDRASNRVPVVILAALKTVCSRSVNFMFFNFL